MKTCKVCREKFTPNRPLQSCCSLDCAIIKGRETSAKQARAEASSKRTSHRAAKIKAKTRGDWSSEAQSAFNRFIRLRDDGKPCVSCGSFTGKKNAGHYRSVGSAPELRFEEANCHLQCEKCNSYMHGNLINYRIELINRIGQEAVDWLEGAHKPAKYTIQELQNIKKIYTLKAKELA